MNTFEYYDRRKDVWSNKETEEMRMEYQYKLFTIIEIADKHRRTPGDILYKLKEHNIISEYKYARGYSDYINSTLYNQIMEKIYNEKKSRDTNIGKYWTSEEDSQLISEYNSGINIKEISKIHKRNIGGIRSRIKLMCSKRETVEDVKEIKQDLKELKEIVTELNGMLKALYDFETS